jgi:hypothetical protein
MEVKYKSWAFYLALFCSGLSFYSFYSYLESSWLFAPPNYILLAMSITAFMLGIKGLKDNSRWLIKLRSWITVALSFLLSVILSFTLLFSLLFSLMDADEYIKTVQSPNGDHTIDFYRFDQGATGTFGVRGELNGPLWFKKRIYNQKGIEEVNIKWLSNNIVSINNHILHLE